MKKLGMWLLLPALMMGTWTGPTLTSADIVAEPSQALSIAGEPSNPAQIEATPMVPESEAPAPASSDPASSEPSNATGTNTVAPADFPNVCDGGTAMQHQTIFTVKLPEGDTTSSLQVRVFPENGGCIPQWGYAGPVLNFPVKADGSYSQSVTLPAGRYVYEYSGDGFETAWGIPFQVTESGPNSVLVKPIPVPATQTVVLNVTIPDGGSSMTIVISDQNGTIEAFTVSDVGLNELTTELPPRGGKYDYYYEYWGDDYPWSDRIPFQVVEGQENVITIAPVRPKITLDPVFGSTNSPTTVQVTVQGFRAFDEYELNFNNGLIIQYGTASDRGGISTSFTVPGGLAPGNYPVVVTGAVTGQGIEANFTVLGAAQLALDPTSGPAGTIMSVSGSGFAPGETVNIRIGTSGGLLRGVVTATKSGTISGRISIPFSTPEGTYPIVATGATSSQSASANFNVTAPVANVTVSPTTQTSGKVVSVTGSGFQPGERVDIRWNGSNGRLLGYITASSTGTVSGRVTVPAGTVPGNYSIHMVGLITARSGSTTLTVTGAKVTVNSTQASPGTVVAVSGSGFGSSERVDIRWNGASGRLLGYRTTSGGAMSGKVTIPADAAPGTYTLHLQGETSGIVGSVKIEIRSAALTDYPELVWRPGYSLDGIAITDSARPTL